MEMDVRADSEAIEANRWASGSGRREAKEALRMMFAVRPQLTEKGVIVFRTPTAKEYARHLSRAPIRLARKEKLMRRPLRWQLLGTSLLLISARASGQTMAIDL